MQRLAGRTKLGAIKNANRFGIADRRGEIRNEKIVSSCYFSLTRRVSIATHSRQRFKTRRPLLTHPSYFFFPVFFLPDLGLLPFPLVGLDFPGLAFPDLDFPDLDFPGFDLPDLDLAGFDLPPADFFESFFRLDLEDFFFFDFGLSESRTRRFFFCPRCGPDARLASHESGSRSALD